jgi:dTDP-4-dehydrorhamnose 3,5-epimerase
MGWIKTNFEGLLVYEPKIFHDERGYFFESYKESDFPEEYRSTIFVQDNEAKSGFGVLRGLHYQLKPFAQMKLVRVVVGEVLDVVVDLRMESSTYGKSFSIILNDIQKKQLLVPHGFAHGYVVLTDEAIFCYKCDQYYSPKHESGLLYNDSALNIDWILPAELIIVSEKDNVQPKFGNHLPF